eukprot:scaffold25932_cov107-Isochrysis_galbana.AAC.5
MRYNSPEVRLLPLRYLCHRLRLGPRLVKASDAVKRQAEETAPKPGNDRVKPRCPPHSESSLARRATGVAAAARHALPMHRVPALWAPRAPVLHAFPSAAAGPPALIHLEIVRSVDREPEHPLLVLRVHRLIGRARVCRGRPQRPVCLLKVGASVCGHHTDRRAHLLGRVSRGAAWHQHGDEQEREQPETRPEEYVARQAGKVRLVHTAQQLEHTRTEILTGEGTEIGQAHEERKHGGLDRGGAQLGGEDEEGHRGGSGEAIASHLVAQDEEFVRDAEGHVEAEHPGQVEQVDGEQQHLRSQGCSGSGLEFQDSGVGLGLGATGDWLG